MCPVEEIPEVEIEHGIERPQGYPSWVKYKFLHEMKPGDSVFIAGQTSHGRAYKAARAHGDYYGKTFSCRTYQDGVRIWRMD